MGKVREAAPLKRLRELTERMKELGLSTATLSDGTSATLAAPRAPFQGEKAQQVIPRRACACGHPLSRHSPNGECLQRQANGAPCFGKCHIIEGEQ